MGLKSLTMSQSSFHRPDPLNVDASWVLVGERRLRIVKKLRTTSLANHSLWLVFREPDGLAYFLWVIPLEDEVLWPRTWSCPDTQNLS